MADTEIDAGEMAVLADSLAAAALAACNARDWIVDAWGMDWGCPDPLKEAFDGFCRTWVTGTDSSGQYIDYGAHYTQAIADAYCAVDQKLAASYNPLHDKSSMPGGYYDPPSSGSGGNGGGPVA